MLAAAPRATFASLAPVKSTQTPALFRPAMAGFPDNDNSAALYGDVIMEHYRSPRHRARLPVADVETEEINPFCGDRACLQLRLRPAGGTSAGGASGDNGAAVIAAVSAVAEGCSIIQASASLLADGVRGRRLDAAADLARRFRDLMQGQPLPPSARAELGDLAALEVVRQYPVRIKCALLPWVALEDGLRRLR